MPPTRRAVIAACIPLAFLFGPCEAENAFFASFKHSVGKALQKEAPTPDRNEPLKVFSVGLSRTGTMSLQTALSELGYKTWHGQMMEETHTDSLTHAYKTGDPSRFLDDLAREGFNASVEFMYFPVVLEALARYPEARVILAVRENSEKWAQSMIEAWRVGELMSAGPLPLIMEFITGMPMDKIWTMWCSNLVWLLGGGSTSPADAMAECLDFEAVQKSRFWDLFFNVHKSAERKVKFTEAYERMNADLRKAVPQERLLEFNVKQGYGPLCRFLGVAEDSCPATFPQVNVAGEMQTAGYISAAIRYGWWVPVLMIFFCVSRCCCRPRKVQKND